MLAVYWAAKLNCHITVKYGTNLAPGYFVANEVLEHYKTTLNITSTQDLFEIASSFLKAFIFFGNDCSPGFFNISHGYGMNVWNDTVMEKKSCCLVDQKDFLELILKTYETKNSGVKRLFSTETESPSVEERIMKARHVIKTMHGVENETIPLVSVLKLQCLRTQFLFTYWTDSSFKGDPKRNGWFQVDNELKVQLQDTEDIYYNIPQQMLTSCGCKGNCKKCKCSKNSAINNKCSRLTCKTCKCFIRQTENEGENLALKQQFQDFMDGLSDEEYTESESEGYGMYEEDSEISIDDEDIF